MVVFSILQGFNIDTVAVVADHTPESNLAATA